MSEETQATTKAVVAMARQLRLKASSARVADPYAKPYECSDDAARKLVSLKMNERERDLLELNPKASPEDVLATRSKGPSDALEILKARAKRADFIYRQEQEEARDRTRRHQNRQVRAKRDREATAAGLTPGQRIDKGLASLAIVASSSATGSFEARVTGSKDQPIPMFPGDPSSKAKAKADEAVRFIEDEVESAKRRRVELERAA